MDTSYKEIAFGDDARQRIQLGVNTLADAVKITMGPSGQNVVIEQPGRPPRLTKDGVSVAQAINLKGRFENLGVQMIKEAAQRSAEIAGDGTTTATVLAQSLYNQGMKLIAAGYDPTEIRQGILAASQQVEQELLELSIPIQSDDEVIQVGTISANGDESIGKLLCEALNTVGRDGTIAVEEAKGFKTSLDIVEGTHLDRGYLSPYFITNQDKMVAELSNPLILLVNKTVGSVNEILPALERAHNEQRSVLIVADDIDGEALKGLVVNRMKGTLNVCAIRSPEFGDTRTHTLADLSILLGAEVVTPAHTEGPGGLDAFHMGTCRKAVISRTETVLIGSSGSSEKIESRIASIRRRLESPALSEPESDALTRRLRRLAGGIAVLRVGGATEIELQERKDRVEDALHATQAAIEEGIVPGGGVALVRVVRPLDKLIQRGDSGFNCGIQAVQLACIEPLRQIVRNAGGSPEVVVEKVKRMTGNRGYDARTCQYVSMVDSGIIDPVKVVRSAVHHASSAACNLLSVGCAMVVDSSKDDEDNIGTICV
jgi:chaperonin GroEL